MAPKASLQILGARSNVADEPPAFPRDREIEDVIEAGGDQHHSGDAMNDAAKCSPMPRTSANQESGNFSANPVMTRMMKLREQNQMLPALVGGHALHHRVLHVAARGGLAAPDDEVVQEHGADDSQG